ncbi:MAG: DoxX family protein [Gemmatales bacterium]
MQRLKHNLLYAMALLYTAAGINHFWHPVFYTVIMPEYLPWKLGLVYASGVIEIVLGLALLFPASRAWAAWGIILMLIVFLSVHLHMVTNTHLYPTVSPILLWLRLPLQGVLIAWAWWYTGTNKRIV